MLAPLVVLCTLIVFASGVVLLLVGPSSRGALLPIHKASFFVWLAVTAIARARPPARDASAGGHALDGGEVRGAIFANVGALPAPGRLESHRASGPARGRAAIARRGAASRDSRSPWC